MTESRRGQAMRRRIQVLCRYIEANLDGPLTLRAMSRRVHVSPQHLQRSFKAFMGITPRQYAEACRLRRLKHALREGWSATDAIHDAGFGSGSRVYERTHAHLGMTPGQYRRGGAGVGISYAVADTIMGLLMIAATDRGVCFVQFGEDGDALLDALRREFPRAEPRPMPPDAEGFAEWIQALEAYLRGGVPLPDMALDMRGTAFQLQVWRYLQGIPHGAVQSYTQVARGISRPDAVRAVAGACAANRVALLVPCHRVIRGDGGLGGYRWGIERKRALMELEARTARPDTANASGNPIAGVRPRVRRA